MTNEYYGTATTPTEDFLAHYGVKGMKWGVRKAIQSGNDRKLSRQYAKAEKKLAKLERRAASGKKYAKRAAALGAGAALAGGIAATGTSGIGSVVRGAGAGLARGSQAVGGALANYRGKGKAATAIRRAGEVVFKKGSKAGIAMQGAGDAVTRWGKGTSIGRGAKNAANAVVQATPKTSKAINAALKGSGHAGLGTQVNKLGNISNSGYTRLAGAVAGAGLGAGAAYNAYRAATTKRAAKKAAAFRSEMNKAFAGTKYANGRPVSQKKRRR